jgi:hypothetical protein
MLARPEGVVCHLLPSQRRTALRVICSGGQLPSAGMERLPQLAPRVTYRRLEELTCFRVLPLGKTVPRLVQPLYHLSPLAALVLVLPSR